MLVKSDFLFPSSLLPISHPESPTLISTPLPPEARPQSLPFTFCFTWESIPKPTNHMPLTDPLCDQRPFLLLRSALSSLLGDGGGWEEVAGSMGMALTSFSSLPAEKLIGQ